MEKPLTTLPPRRKRTVWAWLLIALGVFLLGGFWWSVIGVRGDAPDYDPRRSAAGFWNDFQMANRIHGWRRGDFMALGVMGDAPWVAKVMQEVESGEPFEGGDGNHLDAALAMMTNHDFSEMPDARHAWRVWWRENKQRTQEEWIQDGFRKLGIHVPLPPTRTDWPQLLEILGETAGPAGPAVLGLQGKPAMLYPYYVAFNACRWLRDSGFDPVKFFVNNPEVAQSPEMSGGLIVYRTFETDERAFQPPLPGQMAFATGGAWGFIGRKELYQRSWILTGSYQSLATALCLGLVISGIRKLRRRD